MGFQRDKIPWVEMTAYGSELVAAGIVTEQVMDVRNILQYMGVPIDERTFMFGDSVSVTQSSTIPHSVLRKKTQHTSLSQSM
jgi:hypothetical protein